MAPTENKKPTSKDALKKAPLPKLGKGGKPVKKGPGNLFSRGPGFTGNLISTVLIFLLLISVYTLFSTHGAAKEQISLSQVASDVRAGSVKAIKVSGNDLDLTYADGLEKTRPRTRRKPPGDP